jgi:predicted anti-sigma-YlaC factor YlaD
MQSDELTCKELVELVTDYLEGAMPEVDRGRFEAHLTECDGCTTYVEQIHQTIRITGLLTEASFPDDARAILLDTFRNWKNARS